MKYLLPFLLFMVTQQTFAGNIYSIAAVDTILLANDGDSLVMSKEDWESIVKYYPELLQSNFPANPDLLYAARNKESLYFDSEANKDWYYRVYGFFLKRKNGATKYSVVRKKMDNLFRCLNTLNGRLRCPFGTYYGHREARISGYVEYGVYLYTLAESNTAKQFNIAAQKKLYIATLRQLITDEMVVDNDAVDCAASRKKELQVLVTEIDRLITAKFYLKQAQAFQYSAYDY